MYKFLLAIILCSFIACQPEEPIVEDGPYFPSITSNQWDTLSPDSLNWNSEGIEDLKTFLEENNTRAFIILQDGKIVIEEYWGKDLLGIFDFTKNSSWYWASAGKTLTATAIGLAQQEQFLSIEDKTSKYLGTSWATFPDDESDQVKIRHQLSMTSGFNLNELNFSCTDSDCLIYEFDPEEQWNYHNGPYTLLQDVITEATEVEFDLFLENSLLDKIGAEGNWNPLGSNNIFYSSARDAARFGLFILNRGSWNGEQILDESFYTEMTNSSQSLNPAYGYLWWLNGKDKFILPGNPSILNGMIEPNGPEDMISAMGKNGQFIDVLPDKNMVVLRFGQSPNEDLVPSLFHNEMWNKISEIIE